MKQKKIIVIRGYYLSNDKFGRAKLMFLDDYEDYRKNPTDDKKNLFTKSYFIYKSAHTEGYSPFTDNDTCFYVKLAGIKICTFGIDNPRLAPIEDLIQHKVECVVEINDYKFHMGNEILTGWNVKLLHMKLLEL